MLGNKRKFGPSYFVLMLSRIFVFLVIWLVHIFPDFVYSQTGEGNAPAWFFVENSWKTMEGDSLSWAEVNLDDSEWQAIGPDSSLLYEGPFDDIPKGIFWVRVKVAINDEAVARKIDSLFNQIKGAREIFWDGQKVGKTGVVGVDRATETPGLNVHWAAIPDRLLGRGEHQVAIRLSSNYKKIVDGSIFDSFKLTDDSEEIPEDLGHIYIIRYMFGFASAIFVVYLLIYLFAERKSSYALFGLLSGCLALALYLVTYEFSNPKNFTYDQFTLRSYILLGSVFAFSLLLPAFFLTHFTMKHKMFHMSWIGVALIIALYSTLAFDQRVILFLGIGCGSGFLFAAWATWRRKPGSWLILAGAMAALLPVLFGGVIDLVLLGHVVLVLSFLTAITRQIGQDKIAHQEALLNKANLEASKARLETELIKHSIQPHFLMNTLNALIEWVEEDPKTGVEFIHELSEHFRILLTVSGKQEIKLSQEIDLSRSLLNIMGFRKESSYKLNVDCIDPNDLIPPCILHTLVENGVTHNEYSNAEIEFRLKGERNPTFRTYILETPIESNSSDEEKPSSGTGLKYVKSRLEESYPGRWRLWSGLANDFWVTRIQIYTEAPEL